MMKSLAARLALLYVALIVAASTVAVFGVVTLTRNYFFDAERRSLLVQAQVVAASCSTQCLVDASVRVDLATGLLPAASNIARNQSNVQSDFTVSQGADTQQNVQALIRSNVAVLMVRNSQLVADEGSPSRGSLAVMKALGGVESTSLSGDTIVAAVPVRVGGEIVAVAEVRGSLDNANEVLGEIRRRVLIALSISALLSALVAVWRTRAIARPLRSLTVAAKQLSDGNYRSPLPSGAVGQEVSELVTAFEALRDAVQHQLQARTAFVGDASHELRTPLTAMRGAVEILRSEAGERPEVRQRFLSSLDIEMKRLLELVEDLLTLDQAEHASMKEPELIDIQSIVQAVLQSLEPLAIQRNLTLSCELEPRNATPFLVTGDPLALRQLVINLVENAMVHAPDGEVVLVTISPTQVLGANAESHIILDVRDRGPGLSVEERARVFERFVRADSSRSRAVGGAGLGLAIARTIARAHGGDIEFVDPPTGEAGLVARVTLPM
jgi:two-component system, OmpR family, sensor kinase